MEGQSPPREGIAAGGSPRRGCGVRAGIAPGMSAASSASLAPEVAGDPDRGQRGEKGQAAAGLRSPAKRRRGPVSSPRPFAASLLAALEGGSGGGALCAPHPRGKPGPARPFLGAGTASYYFYPGHQPASVPPLRRAGDKARSSRGVGWGVNCLAPTLRGGTPPPRSPRGGRAALPVPGRGWTGRAAGARRGGGAGAEPGAGSGPNFPSSP